MYCRSLSRLTPSPPAAAANRPHSEARWSIRATRTIRARSILPSRPTSRPAERSRTCSTDSHASRPDARVEPALAERWTFRLTGSPTHFICAAASRSTTERRSPRSTSCTRSSARSNPATKGGRAEPLVPIKGAAEFAAGKAKSVSGLAAPNDTTVVITLARAARRVPEAARDAGRIDRSRLDPCRFRSASGRHGPVEVRRVEARRLPEVRAQRQVLGRRTRDRHAHGTHHPRAEHRRRRVRERQRRHPRHPARRNAAWEQTDEKQAMLQSAPALILYYVAINTTRGPLTDVARAAGDQLRRRHTDHSQAADGRTRLSRSRRRVRRSSMEPTRRGLVMHTTSPRRRSCSPRPVTRTASTSSSGTRRTR